MTEISWLHLTDLHLGHPAENLVSAIRAKFFDDLAILAEHCGPWDLVLFTGDLANKGRQDEFARVDEFLDALLNRVKELTGTAPLLLAVPGNHDLARPEKPLPSALQVLQAWRQEERAQLWSATDAEYRPAIEKTFQHYDAWWKTRSKPLEERGLRRGALPGDFSFTFEKQGARLGVLGLNTAFLHLGNDATRGTLALDPRQFASACGGDGFAWAKKHELCMVLTHHSPDWLREECRTDFQREIADSQYFAFHLFGHMHEGSAQDARLSGGNQHRRSFQGESLFGMPEWGVKDGSHGDRRHGYAAGRIELAEDRATMTLWPRRAMSPDRQMWKFVPAHDSYDLAGNPADDHTSPSSFALPSRFVPRDPAARGEGRGAIKPTVVTVSVKPDPGRKDEYAVRLTVGDVVRARGRVDLDHGIRETIDLFWQFLAGKIWQAHEPVASLPWIEAMGKLLFRSLFNGAVRKAFDQVAATGCHIRLNLELHEAPALAGLPWEYMWEPGTAPRGGGFLSLRSDLKLSRYVTPPPHLNGPPTRLRLMVLPFENPGVDFAAIGGAIDVVKFDDARPPAWEDFEDAMERYKPEIVHLVTKGRGDEKYHGIEWGDRKLTDHEFVARFERFAAGPHAPRLVFLQLRGPSAQQGEECCIATLAQRLLSAGIPFVVALQHQVSAQAASMFVSRFYKNLSKPGDRWVDAAVQEGRQAMYDSAGFKYEFGTAVLYLCSEDMLAAKPPDPASGLPPQGPSTATSLRAPSFAAGPSAPHAESGAAEEPPRPPPEGASSPSGGAPPVTTAQRPQAPAVALRPTRDGTTEFLNVVASMKQAALSAGRHVQLEDQTRDALRKMNWRMTPDALRDFLSDRVRDELDLGVVYAAMLTVLDDAQGGRK